MPVVATSRKHVSELVKGVASFGDDHGLNYNYATVNVRGTLTIDPVGTVLIYNGTTDDFEVFVAQVIATEAAKAQTNNSLPDKAILCVTVGTAEGVGFNKADVLLQAGVDTPFTVMFRGPSGISSDGIEANGSVILDQAYLQFEKQGIAVSAPAEVVVSSFVV